MGRPSKPTSRLKAPYAAIGMGNSFGVLFRITTFGESHGPGLGRRRRRLPSPAPPRCRTRSRASSTAAGRARAAWSASARRRIRSRSSRACSTGVTLGTPIAMLIRNAGRTQQGLREHRARVPPEPRRLHLRREVRDPRDRRRRSGERARDRRAGRGRCDRAAAARAARRLDRRVGRRGLRDHGDASTRRP